MAASQTQDVPAFPGQRLRQPGPRVAEDRLARAPAPGRAARRRGQLRRDRRGRAGGLRPRPLRLLAELAREPPPFRPRRHRAIALDLPGFGDSPMPSWDDRHARLRPADARLLREARHRPGRGAGRQLDGRLRLDRGGDRASPSRFDQLVLVSAAGISFAEAQGRRVEAARCGMSRRRLRSLAGAARALAGRPRARQLAFGRVFQLPEPAAAGAAAGADRSRARSARLRRRDPARSAATTPATAWRRSRSRPWSSGASTTGSSRSRRRSATTA